MAGSLIKIDEEIVTSAVASVTLTGIDSTYDVYMVKVNNFITQTDDVLPLMRVTTSGTAQTDSTYDTAAKNIYTAGTFQNSSHTNNGFVYLTAYGLGTATGEALNGILYLFNFNNASEYSFATMEMSGLTSAGYAEGKTGGFVKKVAEANDGVHFFMNGGNNFTSGTFTLYGLKK